MFSYVRKFMASDNAGGLVALAATALALIVANSPLAAFHHQVFTHTVTEIIDDGPMALFFVLVSLEIKRELVVGDLSVWHQAALPVVAALGGMAMPALVFIAINWTHPEYLRGWAIPTATDIVFSLAALALVGKHLPSSLKVFLVSLAIIDDLGAIVIIAFFYAGGLSWPLLGLAVAVLIVLFVLNRIDAPLWMIITAGVGLWACLLHSGVHPTLAGVATALAVPVERTHGLEKRLNPYVAFLVVPLFIFANAGVTFSGVTSDMLTDSLFLGIAFGLFAGKQIGVMAASWLLLRFTPAALPGGANWRSFHGVAVLCGIGFTMSLFIGDLAFPKSALGSEEIRLGVLLASFASALAGIGLLYLCRSERMDRNGHSSL